MDATEKLSWLSEIAGNPKITCSAARIAAVFVKNICESDFSDLSISQIAAASCLSSSAVRRSLENLQQEKYLKIEKTDGGDKTNRYFIILTPTASDRGTPTASDTPPLPLATGVPKASEQKQGLINSDTPTASDTPPSNTISAKGFSLEKIQKNPPIPPIVPLSPLPAEKSELKITQKSAEPQKKPKNGKKILPWLQTKIWLDYLNSKTGKNFPLKNRDGQYTAGAKLAAERIREHGLQNMMRVADLKIAEWGHSSKWRKFLRPKTLCAKINAEQYLGELSKKVEIFGQEESFEDWVKNREKQKNVIEGDFRRLN